MKGLLPPAAGPQLAAAAAALDRFKAINAELVTLSRRNSNVRSLALSLGRKRTVTAECDDILHALEEPSRNTSSRRRDSIFQRSRFVRSATRQIELTTFGPGDRDGHHAASVLAAYFDVEHTRAFRQLLWRRLAVAAVVASLVEAMTSLLPRTGLLAALMVFAAAALVAAAAEWRAENTLRRLIASRAVRAVEGHA